MLTLEEIESQQDPELVKFLKKYDFYKKAKKKKYCIVDNPNLAESFNIRRFEKPEQFDHHTLLTKAIIKNYTGGFWMEFASSFEDGVIYFHSLVNHFCIKSPNLPYTRLEFNPRIIDEESELENDDVMILVVNDDFFRHEDVKQILHQFIEANNSIVGEAKGISQNALYYKPEFYAHSDIKSWDCFPGKSYIYSTTADAVSHIKVELGVEEIVGTFPQ